MDLETVQSDALQGVTQQEDPVATSDITTLNWVLDEIRNALGESESHLSRQLAEGGDDSSLIETSRHWLHQASGALLMLNLAGTTELANQAEGLIRRVQDGELDLSADVVSAIGRAFNAICEYLQELADGATEQPLWLYSYQKSLFSIGGETPPSPAEFLAFDAQAIDRFKLPDIETSQPDESERAATGMAFEAGLLRALRTNEVEGFAQMRDAAQTGMACAQLHQDKVVWYLVSSWLEAAAENCVEPDDAAKRMLTRANRQLRSTLAGNSTDSSVLLREALFAIACVKAGNDQIDLIVDHFELGGSVPAGYEKPRYGMMDRRATKASLDALKIMKTALESMLSDSGGIDSHIGDFKHGLVGFQDAIDSLDEPGLTRMTGAWVGVVKTLGLENGPVPEALGVELAVSLLFIEQLFHGGFSELDDLDARCSEISRRIDSSLHDVDVSEDAPKWLCELTASVQDRLTMNTVIAEARASIQKAEGVLDAWFRNSEEVEGLPVASENFRELAGVLKLFDHLDAARAAQHIAGVTEAISTEGAQGLTGAADGSDLADSIGALGFFVDALAGQKSILDDFVFTPQTGLFKYEKGSRAIVQAVSNPEDTLAGDVLGLNSDADSENADASDEQTEADAIDSELLEIFLEEAKEVLVELNEATSNLASNRSDQDVQTTIRRGFHTLKGSSRMVGLEVFGECGYAFEELMNQRLTESLPADQALCDLLDDSNEYFGQWITALEENTAQSFDGETLIARANSLRAGSNDELSPTIALGGLVTGVAALSAATAIGSPEAVHANTITESKDDSVESLAVDFPVDEKSTDELLDERIDASIDEPVDSSVEFDTGIDTEITTGKSETIPTIQLGGNDDDVEFSISDEKISDEAAEQIESNAADTNIDAAMDVPFAFDEDATDTDSHDEIVDLSSLDSIESDSDSASKSDAQSDTDSAFDLIFDADETTDSPDPEVAEFSIDDSESSESVDFSQAIASDDTSESGETIDSFESNPLEASWVDLTGVMADTPAAGTSESEQQLGEIVEPGEDVIRIGDREVSAALFEVFNTEIDEIRSVLVPDLSDWHKNPSRAPSEVALRGMHSIKGSAALVQAEPGRSLADQLEQFLMAFGSSGKMSTLVEVTEYGRLMQIMFASLKEFSRQAVPADQPEAIEAARQLLQDWQNTQSAPADVSSVPAGVSKLGLSATAPVDLLDEFDAELLPLFVAEAEEYLPQIDSNLREWQSKPEDADIKQLLMRQLHTVKGSARMAGAMVLGQRVHEMESRVQAAISADQTPEGLVEELIAEQDIVSDEFSLIRNWDNDSATLPDESVTNESAEFGQRVTDQSAGSVAEESLMAATTPIAPDSVAASNTDKPSPAEADSPASSSRAQINTNSLIRVRSEVVAKMVNEAGEVSTTRSRMDNSVAGLRLSLAELSENVSRLRTQLRELEMQADTGIQATESDSVRTEKSDFDPLEFDRYTRFQELTRMLAESVNDVATVQQNATRLLDDAGQDLNRQATSLRQLQYHLMSVRMVQFGSISDRLYRVARQSAKSLGKRVSLDVAGSDSEIDRTILESMVAPLEHLIRNAVSHGIETPEQRVADGKPETGEMRLDIRQDGNEIVMTLTDDGAGINYQGVRDRGIERELIRADEDLSDAELARLIFKPGFSTATTIDQISGRGVGMDVVRTEVLGLGGRVDLNSTTGQGCQFVIHLPLTMAITQVMMTSVGDSVYAVPSASVEKVLQLNPECLSAAYADREIEWDGEKVPLYYLASLVDLSDHSPVAQVFSPVIILRSGGRRIAVHADEVSKGQEVVVKNIGPQLARVPGIAGATVMGNGDVVLIINPGQLAENVSVTVQDAAMEAGMAAQLSDAPPVVMVVDDSVTVRKVTQRLLAREGFEVFLAKDGVDALRQLQDQKPDIMLVDIEMPRMDGFDLTRALRKDERYQEIPIVMITSRTADKHKNFAMSLGVNEFLGKPFNEEELLRIIRSYVGHDNVVLPDKLH